VEIKTKYPDKVQFGIFYLDLAKMKNEYYEAGNLLIKQIEDILRENFTITLRKA
jgi:hypothetical protein